MVLPFKKYFAAEMASITLDITEKWVRNSKKKPVYYLSEGGFDWDSARSPNFLNFNHDRKCLEVDEEAFERIWRIMNKPEERELFPLFLR